MSMRTLSVFVFPCGWRVYLLNIFKYLIAILRSERKMKRDKKEEEGWCTLVQICVIDYVQKFM